MKKIGPQSISAIANAAPQKPSATPAITCREKRFPKRPLIAAPMRGSIGISQRCRFGRHSLSRFT